MGVLFDWPRALCIAGVMWLSAASPAHAQVDSPEAQAVLAVEDAYSAAEVAHDEPVLRRILDDSFVLNRGDGARLGKEAVIAAVLGDPTIGQELTERTVVVRDNIAIVLGTAAVTYKVDATRLGRARHRYTATYHYRDGAWYLLALHVSPWDQLEMRSN